MDSPVLRVSSSDHHVLDTQDHDLAIDDDEVKVTTEVRRAQTVGKSEYILNQYMRGELIGKGQHGSVYVCYDDKGARRAMKVVSRKNPRQDRVKELRKHKLPASGNHIPVTDNFSSTEHKIRKEIAVMKKCRHPHVVRLVEVIDDKLYKKVYMIMEYLAGGEVKWRDNDHNPILTVDQIRRICRDVILGLEYLHQQGIIHRDIKPANLLWTEDRRMVKITDFGVAHISAAHAARTEAHRRTDSSYDDLRLLFDDSELCKTAGTPSFLAPEVVHEYGSELGSETVQSNLTGTATDGVNGSSSTVQQRIISRPPITKAVDIWALGVTLYGMLFGVVPFHQDGAHEYMIYKIICNDDWNVPSTMGYDRIPTGGRHPELEVPEPSEGALVVSLLEGLLEKDASKRATLAEVKRHPWFLRDISNADAWVEDTVSPMASAAPSLLPSSASSPSSPPVGSQQEGQSLSVTEDDYEAAVSQVKFRWDFKNVGKRLVSRFFRKRSSPVPRVPQGRGRGHNAQSVGITSEPSSEMGRYTRRPRSAGGELRSYGSYHNPFRPRTPPKQRNDTPTRQLSQQFPRPSLHVPSPGRSKSVDRPRTTGSAVSSSSHLSNAEDLHGSTRSFSPGSKSRFSMRSLWPSGRNGSSIFGFGGDSTASSSSRQLGTSHHRQASASQGAMRTSNETSPTTSVGRPPGGIQSTGYATPASPQDSFNVRPELRAASWGDVQDYHTRNTGKHAAHAEEVTSVYSGGGDDAPDDDVMLFGAGGIASAPGSSTNFTPFSALDDKGHPVSTGTGKVMAVPVELLHSVPGRDPAAIANPATQGSTSQLTRAAQRVHARSPLVQAYSSGDDADVDAGERLEGGQVPVDSDSASEESFGSDSDDSFFERTSESAGLVRRRRTASEIFGSGSEEGDEGAAQAAIEVRRRRPSFALRGEDEDESGDEDEDGGSEGGNSDDSVDIR